MADSHWNRLPKEDRKRLMPCMIEAQILHIKQCKLKAEATHKAHMRELNSWLWNLERELCERHTD